MTFLIVCVVASIIWGAILICKIVDVIGSVSLISVLFLSVLLHRSLAGS